MAIINRVSVDGTTYDIGGVTGVKGDSEVSYRDGNVNITPDNLGLIFNTAFSSSNKIATMADISAAIVDAIEGSY